METYLVHHGILGQKWGVRRYQNEDGSYTEAGKRRRYSEFSSKEKRQEYRADRRTYGRKAAKRIRSNREAGLSKTKSAEGEYKIRKQDRISVFGSRKGAENIAERIHEGATRQQAIERERTATLARGAKIALAAYGTYKVAKFTSKVVIPTIKAGRAMAEAAKWANIKANSIDLDPSEFREMVDLMVRR